GVNMITGEKLSLAERLITAACFFIPIVGASFVRESGQGIVKFIGKHWDEAVQFVSKYIDEGITLLSKHGGDFLMNIAKKGDELSTLLKRAFNFADEIEFAGVGTLKGDPEVSTKIQDFVSKISGKVDNVSSGTIKGVSNPKLNLISEYVNNDVFSKSVSFNAGEGGTGITYKVFQRNDIDWDMLRSTGAKKGRGLTNAEAAERYGLAPILDADGNVATLHHSQQHSVGPLFEASTRYHNISNAKRAPLHPYKGQLNPFNPMSEEVRKAFQKVDSIEYWKTRGRDAMKGVK
uniref:HNH/ENDO VII family nuclease n=1 Tax=Clostridium sp. D43t1_170807_H7 TaxID=2787140 RepID=UPI001A9AB21D